jgi:hypothetical protein
MHLMVFQADGVASVKLDLPRICNGLTYVEGGHGLQKFDVFDVNSVKAKDSRLPLAGPAGFKRQPRCGSLMSSDGAFPALLSRAASLNRSPPPELSFRESKTPKRIGKNSSTCTNVRARNRES